MACWNLCDQAEGRYGRRLWTFLRTTTVRLSQGAQASGGRWTS